MSSHRADVARTALLFPFQWTTSWGGDTPNSVVTERLVARQCPGARGSLVPLWATSETQPRELTELDPAFQDVFSAQGGPGWTVQRLHVNQEVIGLFSQPRFLGRRTEPLDGPAPRLCGVNLFLFPVGAAVLSLRFDWTADDSIALDDLLTGLDRLRHAIVPKRSNLAALNFTPHKPLSDELLAVLPGWLCAVLQAEERASLHTLADWFVALGDSEESSGTDRFGSSRYAYHHTAVVLDQAPPPTGRVALLHRLALGLGPSYQVDDTEPPGVRLLAPLSNQRLAVAREGTAALSWVTEGSNKEFEVNQWPQRFVGPGAGKGNASKALGIYALLVVARLGQRTGLLRLDRAVADSARRIGRSDPDRSERDHVLELLQDTVVFGAAVTMDDCGGLTRYRTLYAAVGEAWSHDTLLTGVRDAASRLFHLVQLRNEAVALSQSAAAAARDRRFHQFVAAASAIVLPWAVVTSLFGMNIPLAAGGTAREFLPWWIGVGSVGASLGLLSALVARRVLLPNTSVEKTP